MYYGKGEMLMMSDVQFCVFVCGMKSTLDRMRIAEPPFGPETDERISSSIPVWRSDDQ